MKIIVAPDSFKGSLTAVQAAEHMARGIRRASPESDIHCFPIADGGEGTADALIRATGGRWVPVRVMDPLIREIESGYGVLGDGETAVVELAAASGLTLLTAAERNPMITSTYGTGQLVRAALEDGFRKVLIGIGGSATNDGGTGMLQALGVQFYNVEGKLMDPTGGTLGQIARFDTTNLLASCLNTDFQVACDVDNPLCGPNGAAVVFAPQKGASPESVQQLDEQLYAFGRLVEKQLGCDVLNLPGAGAAGGTGGALAAFLHGKLVSGIELVLTYAGLEREIAHADLVFTGEGRLDSQTLHGKAPLGVARAAKEYGVSVIGIAGSLGEGAETLVAAGFNRLYGLVKPGVSVEMAMNDAGILLEAEAERAMTAYLDI